MQDELCTQRPEEAYLFINEFSEYWWPRVEAHFPRSWRSDEVELDVAAAVTKGADAAIMAVRHALQRRGRRLRREATAEIAAVKAAEKEAI